MRLIVRSGLLTLVFSVCPTTWTFAQPPETGVSEPARTVERSLDREGWSTAVRSVWSCRTTPTSCAAICST